MKLALTVLAAATACSGSGSGGAAPPPVVNTADATACATSAANLHAWLTALAAEGHATVMAGDVHLVTVPGHAIAPIPSAPIVTVKPAELELQGKLLGDPSHDAPAALATALADAVRATPGADVVFVIDGRVGWSTVAALIDASAGAGHGHASFVLGAGAPSAVSAPPPSSIDAELAAVESPHGGRAAELAHPGPSLGDKVFANCPPVTSDLFPKLASADGSGRDALVVDGLPRAIQACHCGVEIPAVQRLMWAWWGRDTGTPMFAVTLAVTGSGGGSAVAGGTTWADSARVVVAAASRHAPVTLTQ